METEKTPNIIYRIRKVQQLCQAISKEKHDTKLLETFLEGMLTLAHAEGGALYLLNEKRTKLHCTLFNHRTMGIKMGGSSQVKVSHDDISLFDAEKRPNYHHPLCLALLKDEIINIDDIYLVHDLDFQKQKKFDKLTQYKTRSLLIIPLKDHNEEFLGVVELYNANNENNEVISFDQETEVLTHLYCSWATVIQRNQALNIDLRKLFESIVQVLASAIDEKSPYTGGHCRRVPIITMMITSALEEVDYGPFASFKLSDEERYEMQLGALLHDCGKVTTPVHVMDKATKLETIFDRIELIDTRFEIVMRDREIEKLKKKIKLLEDQAKHHGHGHDHEDHGKKTKNSFKDLEKNFHAECEKIYEDREFIRRNNVGVEQMTGDNKKRVHEIAEKYTWKNPEGIVIPFLNYDEIKNINITRGTLNADEREIINNHAEMTLKMLSHMHFPKHLQRIPEIASCHHEKMNGHGYPRGLHKEEMSVQARLMGVADIFEALTAKDRPYKKGKTLSESLKIMAQMRIDQHIDGDIFDVFVDKKIYMQYAQEFLDHSQIDHVDLDNLQGYVRPELRDGQDYTIESEGRGVDKKAA